MIATASIPVPAKPDYIFLVDGQSHNVSSALNAISGDVCGWSVTMLPSETPQRQEISDGQVDHSELLNATLFDIPEELWRKTDAGFILVDGFGHPFQYTPPGPQTVSRRTTTSGQFGGTSPPANQDRQGHQAISSLGPMDQGEAGRAP